MNIRIPLFLLLGLFVSHSVSLRAQWTGALTGTANDVDHSYTRTANPPWTGSTPEDTWTGTLAGATTLYFGGNYTTAGLWTLTPGGNFALTLQGGGTVAPDGTATVAGDRTVTLGGNLLVDHTGASSRQVILGSTVADSALFLDLNGAARTFTVNSGSTLRLLNNLLSTGGNAALAVDGGGTLQFAGGAAQTMAVSSTTISNASTLQWTGSFATGAYAFGASGSTIALDGNGRFQLSNSSSGNALTLNNVFQIGSGGGRIETFRTGNPNERYVLSGNTTLGGDLVYTIAGGTASSELTGDFLVTGGNRALTVLQASANGWVNLMNGDISEDAPRTLTLGTGSLSGVTAGRTISLSGNNTISHIQVVAPGAPSASTGNFRFTNLNSLPELSLKIGDGTFVGLGFGGAADVNTALALITADSTGVLGIDAAIANDIDLSPGGLNRDLRIGSSLTGAGGVYTGVLTPFGTEYKLGGGGGVLFLGLENQLTGARSVHVGGAGSNPVGSVVLAAANNYSGATTVNAGVLVVRNSAALGSGVVTSNGGALQFDTNAQTHDNDFVLGTDQTVTFNSLVTLTGGVNAGALTHTFSGVNGGVVLAPGVGKSVTASGLWNVATAIAPASIGELSTGGVSLNGNGVVVLGPGFDFADFGGGLTRVDGVPGPGEWRANGGGFAARGTHAVVPAGFAGANFWDRNFLLGTAARNADGSFFASKTVVIGDDIDLNASRTITLAHAGPGLTGDRFAQAAQGRIEGNISGSGALSFAGTLSGNNNVFRNAIGEIVLAGENTWTGGIHNLINTGPGGLAIGTGQTVFVRFDDTQRLSGTSLPTGDGVTPNQWISIKNNNSGYTETHGGAHGFLFTGDANGQVYNLPTYTRMVIGSTDGSDRGGSIGATSENVNGGNVSLGRAVVAINHGTGNVTETLGLFVRDGTFQLGNGSDQVVFVPTINPNATSDPLNRTALSDTAASRVLNKRGEGTLILENVAYNALGVDGQGTGVDKKSQFTWVIGTSVNGPFDGAVRETGTTSNNSLRDFAINLRGGVLESNNDLSNYGGVGFTRGLGTGSTSVNWGAGGGGFAAHGGAFDININATPADMEWRDTSFVGAANSADALIFGSLTADNVVTFQNTIALANSDNQTVAREIKVIDNPDSAGDVAVMSGNILNRGSGAAGGSGFRSLRKTGDGVLLLSGTNTYNGTTSIEGGVLLINGLHTSTQASTVSGGATLGGSGRIAGAVRGAGMVSPGNSPGIFSADSVTGSEGTDFSFEFGQEIAPTWSDATDSGNDVLRLRGAVPFVDSLGPDNVVDLYFAQYGTYQGGFFTDLDSEFTTEIEDATFRYFLESPGGSVSFGGKTYDPFSPGAVALSSYSVVQVATADFADGAVSNGWTMEFVVIPEPGVLGLLIFGLGLVTRLRRAGA